ncbi:hypothetical protein GQ53DRAFT_839575 [Thozetella sp. PMI_491]|nr:hypothetical protein GQ53DRAFT_839575 [Thozetella sp. PMI_491]
MEQSQPRTLATTVARRPAQGRQRHETRPSHNHDPARCNEDLSPVPVTSERPERSVERVAWNHLSSSDEKEEALTDSMRRIEQLLDAAQDSIITALPLPDPLVSAQLLPFLQLNEDAQPHLRELLYGYFFGITIEQFPVICSDPTCNGADSWMLKIVADDALVQYGIAYSTHVYFQHKRTRSSIDCIDKRAQLYLAKVLRLVRNDVMNAKETVSPSTLLSIVAMCIVASCVGDVEVARNHARGISKLVCLQGGIENMGPFRTRLCRADLNAAVASGLKPFFYRSARGWGRYLSGSVSLTGYPGLRALLSYIDRQLIAVWADLRLMCETSNKSKPGKSFARYDITVYEELMISILYRLLHQEYDSDSPEEALRLAMVIFSSSLFLQYRGHNFYFAGSSDLLHTTLTKLPTRNQVGSPMGRLVVWMHCILAVGSNYDSKTLQPRLPELKAAMQKQGISSWADLRETVKDFLWIDCIHDELGEKLYDATVAQ